MESKLAFAQYAVQLCSMQSDLTLETEFGAGGFLVYALIRSSSKYAYQGVVTDMPVMMRLIRVDESDEYAFHLENGNRYRREDLTFFAKSSSGLVIKLR